MDGEIEQACGWGIGFRWKVGCTVTYIRGSCWDCTHPTGGIEYSASGAAV